MKSDLPTKAYYGYVGRVDARKGKTKVTETETSPSTLETGEPVKKVWKVNKAAGK